MTLRYDDDHNFDDSDLFESEEDYIDRLDEVDLEEDFLESEFDWSPEDDMEDDEQED